MNSINQTLFEQLKLELWRVTLFVSIRLSTGGGLKTEWKQSLICQKCLILKTHNHLVSLTDIESMVLIKTKYCKYVTCIICWETLSTTHILCNCQQLNILFSNSDLYSNTVINTFPTDVQYNPKYLVPLAHLLPKSPIGPLIWLVFECISYVMSVSAYACSCVCMSKLQ